MTAKVHLARWRSAAAEQRFRAMEDALWDDVVTRPAAVDVETRFGPTRAYRWKGTGVPVVLLHGVAGTSIIWHDMAGALAGRDVVAVDIMGDVGRSQQQVPFESAADFAVWLDDTLGALGIDRAHVVGLSLGGYVALDLAVHRPRRVVSLVLFDPAGIVKLSMLKFMLWGLPILFGSLAPAFIRRWLARRLRMPLLENKRAMRMALHGQLNHPPRFPPLVLFTDDELRSVTMPVTLVAGEKTEMFDTAAMVERAMNLLPNVTAELVPGAGHALTVSHAELCASRVSHVTDATL